MKTIFPIALILIATSTLPSFADEKNWSVGFSNTGIQFKNLKKNESGMFFGGSYFYTNSDGNVSDLNSVFGVEAGYRAYTEIADTNKFIDSSIEYISINNDTTSDRDIYNLNLRYGVEKYIGEDISVEGSAGVRITAEDYNGGNSTSVFFPAARVSINYRF